jgi:ATP-dependent Clp protease ATP-binding subunit ClpA
MMARRLTRDARLVLSNAVDEASARQASHVEAEHLLLAMTSVRATAATRALTAIGLDHRGIEQALDEEFAASLGAAGVVLPKGGLPEPSPDHRRRSRMGASSKAALIRAFELTGVKHAESGHLLLGVLGAETGTVPRALQLRGIDREELRSRTEQELAAG